MTQKNVTRRTLVKGATWAAPALATTALVPAYAASYCTDDDLAPDRTVPSGGFNSTGNNTFFLMYQASTGDIILKGIPENVTVDSLEVSFIFRTRYLDSDGRVMGLPALNQSTLPANQVTTGTPRNPEYYIGKTAQASYDTKDQTAAHWTRVAPSTSSVTTIDYWDFEKGGTAKATITRDLPMKFPDGGTYNGWKIDLPTWYSDKPDGYRVESYSMADEKGCKTFTLPKFADMAFHYKNAQFPYFNKEDVDDDGNLYRNNYYVFLRSTYHLSNGRTVVLDTWREAYAPGWPTAGEQISIS